MPGKKQTHGIPDGFVIDGYYRIVTVGEDPRGHALIGKTVIDDHNQENKMSIKHSAFLVETDWLEKNISHPDLKIIDFHYNLESPGRC